MKIQMRSLLLLTAMCSSLLATATPDTWTKRMDLGMVRSGMVAFSIGTKGYVGMGNDGTNVYNDFWEFETTTNIWTQKASHPTLGRSDAVGFSIGTNGYVALGEEPLNAAHGDLWEYKPSLNTWVQKANFGGGARRYAVGFTIGSKGYIGTGAVSPGNDFWEYDPSLDTWTQKASLGTNSDGRYLAAGFAVGGKGYIGTGFGGSNRDDFWEYDPSADAWTQKGNFPGGARLRATGFAIGSKGYLGTGQAPGPASDMWEYEPATDAWTQKANFAGGTRQTAIAFSVGTMAYMGTGISSGILGGTYMGDLWAFDPVANTWTSKAGFGGPARRSAAAFSIGSKGYVGTGINAAGLPTNDFWEYDPANDAWTQKANVGGGLRSNAVGFAIGSKGYVSTGNPGSIPFLQDLWEYDPTVNTWTQKANLPGDARIDAIGFTIGSKGYVGCGFSVVNPAGNRDDFWEYDPTANTWTQKATVPGGGRLAGVGFGIGTLGYAGLGFGGAGVDFHEYDPSSNTWTPASNFPGGSVVAGVGFNLGSMGYVYTGTSPQAFYQYDPVADVWSQRSSYPGAGAGGASGFAIGSKGYVGFGQGAGNAYQQDFWEYDALDCQGAIGGNAIPGSACNDNNFCTVNDVWNSFCGCAGTFADTDNDGFCDAIDSCPLVPGLIGDGCNDNNPNTSNDVINGSCVCAGTPNCTENLTLEMETDGNGAQITWQVVNIGTNTVVKSGPIVTYGNNSTSTETICLPIGCYELKVMDSGNNGITGGGYILRDPANKRLIDSRDNGGFAGLSQIAANQGFCTNAGTQVLTAGTTDVETMLITDQVIASPNATVSSEFTLNTNSNLADDGYQFWIFDPHGTYSVMKFQSHANPGNGGGSGATKACHLKLNIMAGLPVNTLLNVRVRNRVNGVNSAFGPASRLMVITGPPPCPMAQMVNSGLLNSCNVSKTVGGSDKIYCYNVPGANKYRFEIRYDPESYVRLTVGYNNSLTLANWVVNPLICGTVTYDVSAQCSFDGGSTWCPLGAMCPVTIFNSPSNNCTSTIGGSGGGLNAVYAEETIALSIYPNPANSSRVMVEMTGIAPEVEEVAIVLFDLYGKQITSNTIAMDGAEQMSTLLELPNVAAGLYMVQVTAGAQLFSRRLVVE